MSEPSDSGIMRRMTREDLNMVRAWRNHAAVRRYMYTQHEIGAEEHASWFKRVDEDSCKHLLVFEYGGESRGFVHFSLINQSVADWGFYLAPDAPRGSGWLLGQAALAYAFQELTLHKVCGQALSFNERSIKFHLRLGFQQEGTLRAQHFDGRDRHDVICFGLLASEWPVST